MSSSGAPNGPIYDSRHHSRRIPRFWLEPFEHRATDINARSDSVGVRLERPGERIIENRSFRLDSVEMRVFGDASEKRTERLERSRPHLDGIGAPTRKQGVWSSESTAEIRDRRGDRIIENKNHKPHIHGRPSEMPMERNRGRLENRAHSEQVSKGINEEPVFGAKSGPSRGEWLEKLGGFSDPNTERLRPRGERVVENEKKPGRTHERPPIQSSSRP